jgi:nitrate/TMAO reductase-like tetraheme cytochrome c subunit
VKIKDCVEAFRMMIYCLEGDCHAMDDKLKEILIKLELYDPAYFPSDKDDTHRPHRKNKKDKDHDKKDHEKRDQEKKDQEKKDHEKRLADKKAALQRKMEDESAHGITHKMARIDIHKDEREAERVIQQAVAAIVPEP